MCHLTGGTGKGAYQLRVSASSELDLQDVFSVCLRLPSGPEILHFMRYKEQRCRIGQNTFNTALDYTATAGTVYGMTCNYLLDNSCEFNIEIIKDNF